MSLPGQMYDNALNPSKGWPSQSALDHTAKISANVLYDLKPGQVCHLNASGQLEPGVIKHQMGLFIFQGKNDLDVNNERNDEWTPVSPTGKVACFVATGAFELETTEFDSSLSYAYNDPLRAPTGNAADGYTVAKSGKLTNASVTLASQTDSPQTSSTAVCGIVSRGVFKNNYGKNVLAFWPVWYPGRSTES